MMNYLLRKMYLNAWIVGLILYSLSAPAQHLAVLPGGLAPGKTAIPSSSDQQQTQTLKTVLQELEKQYQVYFNYNAETVESIVVPLRPQSSQSSSLEEVLSDYLKEHNLGYKQLEQGYYMIYTLPDSAKLAPVKRQPVRTDSSSIQLPTNPSQVINRRFIQQKLAEKAITGRVTDLSTSEGLPGVNVVVKNTAIGTVTDIDGNYRLTAPDDAEALVFSSVGYLSEEVVIGNQTVINMEMAPDIQSLNEVVVIGYGTQKKSDLTGAVATVGSEEIMALPAPDVQQALKGRAAGVRVVQNSGRPGSAVQIQIRGGNSYLGNNNPLYVVDGFPIAGGVDFLNPSDIENIDILKDASATAIYGSRGANGVVIITTKAGRKGEAGTIDVQSYYGVQRAINTYDVMNAQQFAEFANVWAVNEELELPFDAGNLGGIGTDWQDLIFRSAPIQNHTVTFSGGSETSSYSVSANYFDQEGIIVGSDLTRGSLNLSLNNQVNDRIRLSTNMVITRSEINDVNADNGTSGDNIFSASLVAPPVVAPFDTDGNYSVVDGFAFSPAVLQNPLAYREVLDQRLSTKFLGNVAIEFDLLENLSFKVLAGSEQEFVEANFYSPSVLPKRSPTGSARTDLIRDVSYLNENTLTYSKQLGEGSQLSAVAGFTVQTFKGKFNRSESTGFANDLLQNNALGNGELTLPNLSEVEDWLLLSWLGRVNYTLQDKYLFTASIRADGSSRFGANNKWGVFSSGAFAWKLNNEAFLEDWQRLSELKLRLAYGQTGSTAIDPYQSLNIFDQARATFGNTDVIGFASDAAPNADLKWETTSQFNAGLDIGFDYNRYRLTIDWYRKNTTDLLAVIPLPGSVGFTSVTTNLGEIQNTGMEFSLGALVAEGTFNWDITGQLSFNVNEVIEIGEDILGGDLPIPFSAPTNIAREGEPLGMFFGFREDGLDDQGVLKYKDLNNDGEITNEDQEIIGNPYPDFIYGFNNTLSYKNFQLNVFIEGSQGNDLFWATGGFVANSFGFGGNNLTENYQDFWTPQNTDAAYPAPSNNRAQYRVSDRFVEDGSYLRLKNVRLSYNIPVNTIPGVKSLQLYVSGQNLLTLTNYRGLDPEVSTRSRQGDLRLGIDQTGYPSAKIYTVGLNLQF